MVPSETQIGKAHKKPNHIQENDYQPLCAYCARRCILQFRSPNAVTSITLDPHGSFRGLLG